MWSYRIEGGGHRSFNHAGLTKEKKWHIENETRLRTNIYNNTNIDVEYVYLQLEKVGY